MKIDVKKISENADGSVDYLFDLDPETLTILARIGLEKILKEAAEKYGHLNPEGAGDAEAGEDGDPPVHGEVPGL